MGTLKPQGTDSKARSGLRTDGGFWSWALFIATILLLLVSLDFIFNTKIFSFVTGVQHQFFYSVLALMIPMVFIIWPISKRISNGLTRGLDITLALVSFVVLSYFVVNGETIIYEGWEYMAPDRAVVMSGLFWVLLLEALRRVAGLPITIIAGVASIYPVFADVVPGPIQGFSSSAGETAAFHAMSLESIIGIPFQSFANLVIGFMLFGVALQKTGGGKFFIDLAFALLGKVRGGPAKVAVLSSGMMGSLSGSVITNVITTGALSIPAMKRSGFSPKYAAGVEACASTGGTLMPPVMGATAFVMASFLNIPYATIALAAVIPSILYFLGLFLQIDAYAAKNNIKGLSEEELPSLKATLKEGWYYIFAFGFLIWMLFFLGREAQAPFYATAVLIIINQILPYNRWNLKSVVDFFTSSGKVLVELTTILAGVGLLVGALTMTGLSGTIANDLIYLAGGDAIILLFMGALTSFILGIGMTVTAAYIFLAVALAPALVNGAGMDALAVHMFILYWGMLSFITPPVALGAFAAASIAGSKPMETGFSAMKLGSIIYVIPFLFVLNPSLLFQGELLETALSFVQAVIGVVLVSAAIQGWLLGVGTLAKGPLYGALPRALVFISGLMIALPGTAVAGLSEIQLLMMGFLVLGVGLALLMFTRVPQSVVRSFT